MNYGWICPKCHRVYAPTVQTCTWCVPYTVNPWPYNPYPHYPTTYPGVWYGTTTTSSPNLC